MIIYNVGEGCSDLQIPQHTVYLIQLFKQSDDDSYARLWTCGSDVVIVHWFSWCVTVMKEKNHHSLKHSFFALSAL